MYTISHACAPARDLHHPRDHVTCPSCAWSPLLCAGSLCVILLRDTRSLVHSDFSNAPVVASVSAHSARVARSYSPLAFAAGF